MSTAPDSHNIEHSILGILSDTFGGGSGVSNDNKKSVLLLLQKVLNMVVESMKKGEGALRTIKFSSAFFQDVKKKKAFVDILLLYNAKIIKVESNESLSLDGVKIYAERVLLAVNSILNSQRTNSEQFDFQKSSLISTGNAFKSQGLDQARRQEVEYLVAQRDDLLNEHLGKLKVSREFVINPKKRDEKMAMKNFKGPSHAKQIAENQKKRTLRNVEKTWETEATRIVKNLLEKEVFLETNVIFKFGRDKICVKFSPLETILDMENFLLNYVFDKEKLDSASGKMETRLKLKKVEEKLNQMIITEKLLPKSNSADSVAITKQLKEQLKGEQTLSSLKLMGGGGIILESKIEHFPQKQSLLNFLTNEAKNRLKLDPLSSARRVKLSQKTIQRSYSAGLGHI
eukprot:snap_masked-scaffold_23-processed-gene-5.22-mRNA-1 protein AED:1.00 eAED:1.00 QI:0/-1/0/0/-1/1/1/0/399